MKIILLSDGGGARTFRLRKRFVTLLAAALAIPFALLLVAQQMPADLSDHPMVSDWRAKLDQQKTRLRGLRLRSQAQSEAMGRQLALLQARLTRMEALGLRVAEVAQLDADEFSFREPPALGGPAGDARGMGAQEFEANFMQGLTVEAQALPFAGLDQSLASLSAASLSAERKKRRFFASARLRDKRKRGKRGNRKCVFWR